MKQLKQEYVESLPIKRERIVQLFQQKNFEQLETEFHKMKGTGKTYGLPEISLLGELFEKVCMNQATLLPEAIPVAVAFLNEIFRLRKLDQIFAIEESDEYQKLKFEIRKSSASEGK